METRSRLFLECLLLAFVAASMFLLSSAASPTIPTALANGPLPDLAVVDVDAPASAVTQHQIGVSWTVQNQGDMEADVNPDPAYVDWRDALYLSADDVWDESDVMLVDTARFGSLAVDASYVETHTVTIPGVPPGGYYLLAGTDWITCGAMTCGRGSALSESDEADNLFAQPIAVLAPDLAVVDVDAPASALTLHQVEVSWTVQNQGDGEADVNSDPAWVDWRDYLYLSPDSLWDESDIVLRDTARFGSLAAGASYTETQVVTIPNVPPGGYYLLAGTDWIVCGAVSCIRGSALYESNEDNNLFAQPITLQTGGSVSGHVYESDGSTPIAGATVKVWDYAQQGPLQAPPVDQATTDGAGYYQVAGIAAGDYRVNAWAAGHAVEQYQETFGWNLADVVAVVDGLDTPDIDFTLDQGGSISGNVTSQATGLPLAGVSVMAVFADGSPGGMVVTSNAIGDYTLVGLPFGAYEVQSPAPLRMGPGDDGYLFEYWQEHADSGAADAVSVSLGVNPTGIDFTLERPGSVSGQVFEADGSTAIAGAAVKVWDHAQLLPLQAPPVGQAVTDGSGYYQVAGIAAGDYRVSAVAPNHAVEFYQETFGWNLAGAVPIAEGLDTPDTDFTLDPGGTISGTVTHESTGLPLAEVSVMAVFADGSPGGMVVTSDGNGDYVLFGLPYGSYVVRAPASYRMGLGDGNYVTEWWQGRAARDEADVVAVSPGSSPTGIDFALEQGGSISGQVFESTGTTPLSGAVIEVLDYATSAAFSGATAQADGSYSVAGLPAGSYRVSAVASGHVRRYWPGTLVRSEATPVVVAAPGDASNIDFSLEAGGAISGTVTDEFTGLPVADISVQAVRSDGPGGANATTGQNGSYTITGLPFGQYRVVSPSHLELGSADAGYIREFYNGKGDFNSADLVGISTGSPGAAGVDFSLSAGPASISGTVTDEAGHPIVNATVSADYWTGGRAATARTDAQGAYALGSLPGGDYLVQAQATGRMREYYNNTFNLSWATPVHVTTPADTPGINFSLEPAGSISGRVTDTTGNPLSGVGVVADAGDFGLGAQTSATGDYTIAAPFGQYRVRAPAYDGWAPGDDGWAREYYDNQLEWDSADLVTLAAASENATGIDFALEEGGSISGSVTDDLGNPIADADVWADCWAGGTAGKTRTDAQGDYLIMGLPAGDYRVQAQAVGRVRLVYDGLFDYQQATPVTVTALNDTPNIDFALEPGGAISGTVTSLATGLPLADVSVDAGPVGETWGAGDRTDANGDYTVTGLPFGQYRVSAPSGGRWGSGDDSLIIVYYNNQLQWGSADLVTIAAGSQNATGINFALEQGGSISGSVTDELGNPVADADVWADYWAGGVAAKTTTDGQGYYFLAGLPAGDYRVQAQAVGKVRKVYDGLFDYQQATPVGVTAGVDTADIDFSLEPGGAISGTVTSQATGLPLADVSVNASRAGESWGAGDRTDENGDYTLTGLPFGQYRVTSPSGGRWGSGDDNYIAEYYDNEPDANTADLVTLAAGSENATGIDFALEQGGFITGTVLDQNTGLPVEDASYGSIELSAGWHRLVYRLEELTGASEARAGFKAPGDAGWRLTSTSEMEVRTADDHAAPEGIALVNKKNNLTVHPVNHGGLVVVVDLLSTPDAGWYGESVVDAINQNQNIHGNDDYFTSYYEAYFYVTTAGTWWFSTDSDDASELVIDDQVVACWYNGHGAAGRWDHKAWVSVIEYASGVNLGGMVPAADGGYRLGPFPSGTYRVMASAPGYANEFYQEAPAYPWADAVAVSPPANTADIDLTLEKTTGSISGNVSYSGAVAGGHSIYVWARTLAGLSYPEIVPSPGGAYALTSMPDGAYLMQAFLDADDDMAVSPGDPIGFYPEPVLVTGGPVTGIDIYLDDTPMGLAVGTLKLQGRESAEGATITFDNGSQQFSTMPFPNGAFVISGPVGTYDVTVQMPGYLPATRSGVVLDDVTLYAPGQQPPQLPHLVLLGGDVDWNGHVDIADLAVIAAGFNTSIVLVYGDDDLNGDGCVNILDLVLAGKNFGKSATPWP